MLPFLMCLLLLCSLSAGFPFSSTTGAPSASGNIPTANVSYPATNQMLGEPGVSYNESAETFADLQSDMSIGEGDIILEEDRNAVNNIWLNGIVPYTISPELESRRAEIMAAFQMIMSATCIRFQAHVNELNYLEIKDGQGCASFVGCRGGSQPVFFESSCSVGNLCHELIHSLGLHHEHTRQDRDQHITINWPNIQPGKEVNFKIKAGDTLNLPYDPESIMHYGKAYFSVDGNPTILTREDVDIGQRTHLSQLDKQKLNALYHCYQ